MIKRLLVFSLLVPISGTGADWTVTDPYVQDFPARTAETIDALIPDASNAIVYPEVSASFEYASLFVGPNGWTLLTPKDQTKPFVLRVYTAPSSPRQNKRTVEVQVSTKIAKAIVDLWMNAILRSQYRLDTDATPDDTGYSFGATARGVGTLRAYTTGAMLDRADHSPPLWMVTIGQFVGAWANSNPRREDELLYGLNEVKGRLIAYYKVRRITQGSKLLPCRPTNTCSAP
jgi:hypothetical protein